MLVGSFVYLSVCFVQVVNDSWSYVVVVDSDVGGVFRVHRPCVELGTVASI